VLQKLSVKLNFLEQLLFESRLCKVKSHHSTFHIHPTKVWWAYGKRQEIVITIYIYTQKQTVSVHTLNILDSGFPFLVVNFVI